MQIRSYEDSDYEAVWEIFSRVIATGDTYVFSPDSPPEIMEKAWLRYRPFVLENEGRVVGSYIIKPNQPGLGAHIANASYMVHPDFQGKGIGQAMGEHSLRMGKAQGYHGLQFNIVVATNIAAVQLWKKLGFHIIGTVPKAFHNLKHGYVDSFIMFRELDDIEEDG